MWKRLCGKRTYLVGALLLVTHGLASAGIIPAGTEQGIRTILEGVGLITLRAAVAAKPATPQ